MRLARCLSAALAITFCSSACSPRQFGISRMASALTDTATSYATDNDPEFVRLAAPSTLKMVEMLLDAQPAHQGLLLTACSGFAQYAYAFLQLESEREAPTDKARSAELAARAQAMYSRARGYCWRALEEQHRGIRQRVLQSPQEAVREIKASDVPLVYWLSAAWGGELSLANNQLLRLQDLVAIRVLLGRALELDEAWGTGALHEAFIALDGMPLLLGGRAERARSHFDRAVALSEGQSAFAYVTLASSVAVAARDRAGFERLLRAALAIDVDKRPELRLANLVAQRRARFLLSRADALFPKPR